MRSLQRTISRKTRVRCDNTKLYLSEDEDDGNRMEEPEHAVCEKAMDVWVKIRHDIVTAWLEKSREVLEDEENINCELCRYTLLEALRWVLVSMRWVEREEQLNYVEGEEKEWL